MSFESKLVVEKSLKPKGNSIKSGVPLTCLTHQSNPMKKFFLFRKPVSIRLVCCATLSIVCACLSSCSKEEMDEMVSKAKDSATEFKEKSGDALSKAKAGASDAASKLKETTGQIKEKASNITQSAGNMMSMNGSAEIKLDAPTKFPASYVRVVPLAPGRSVVQLKSYSEDGVSTTFPAYFLQGVADLKSGSLDGQAVPCRFFAQKTAEGDVWENVPGQLVLVKFTKSAKSMTASFSNASLVNLASNAQTNSSGSFECVDLK